MMVPVPVTLEHVHSSVTCETGVISLRIRRQAERDAETHLKDSPITWLGFENRTSITHVNALFHPASGTQRQPGRGALGVGI